MENINETIKKILLNIQYDNKLTLKENFDAIELVEQRVGAQTLADLKSALGELKDVKSLFKLKMAESRILKLIEMDASNFLKEVEKAVKLDLKAGVPAGTIGPNLKEVSKLDAVRRITNEVARTKRPLTPAQVESIKNAARADSITATTTVKYNPKPPKPPVQPNPVPAPPPKPKMDSLKKWAGYAGIAILGSAAVYALYNWLNGKGNDKELLDVAKKCGYNSIEEFQAANFKCPKGGNVIPPTRKFRNCENETVQTFGCKSSLIRQIQDCLGVVIDGFWGPKTNTALVANAPKFAAGFTKDDIKEICASGSGKIVDKTTEREKIIDPQDVGSASASSNTSDSSTTGGQSSPTNKSSFTTGGFDPNSMD
jgi:hypothetical protein